MGRFATLKRSVVKLAWIVAILIPLLAVGGTALWLSNPSQAAQQVPEAVTGLESFQRGFSWVAEQIRPSIVFIEVEQKVDASAANEDTMDQDRWREFFGPDVPFPFPSPRGPQQQQPQPRVPPVGQGSGIIIDPAGYVLTNKHVAEDAARITVHTTDGQTLPATVVGTDDLTDLAVIKVKPARPLAAAELGDADKLQVGAWAIAVGYPFGGDRGSGRFDAPQHFEPTITVGVISALNRQIQSETSGQPFRNLIQTDAPINPGNSGGPLMNIRAQVIGVNQAIYTSGLLAGNIGVGFAIPINAHTKSVIATLKQGESFVRGRLGVMVEPMTDAMKQVWGTQHGVFISEVDKESPAGRAGLKNEDIIVSYQGQPVDAQDEFVNLVQATKPGTKAKVEVLRDGKRMTFSPTIEALTPAAEPKPVAAAESETMGLTVEPIPAEMAEKTGVREGVRVRSVASLSDAARAGVQPGDLLVRVNRDAVTDAASYQAAVKGLKKGEPVVLRIWRQGHYHTLEVESLSE